MGKQTEGAAEKFPSSDPNLLDAGFGGVACMPLACSRVKERMGYILVIVALVVVIPLVLLLGRKTSTGGGGLRHTSRGVTVEEPSSDQPSPAGSSVNQPRAGAEKKLPPG